MTFLWNTIFYEPIYNTLIFLISVVPFGDVGIAVILLTILVKLILFPLSQKAVRSQIKLKELSPLLNQIKKDFPNKEEQARKTFELYKEKKINPFSGCLVLLIQLPFIFALYFVFFRGLDFNTDILYSFIHLPEAFSTSFLGLVDIQGKSIVISILAGVTQFFQAKFNAPISQDGMDPKSFQAQFSKSMQIQVRYVLPVFIIIISYQISAAVALYWTTSNLFTICQEIYIRRKIKKEGKRNTVEVLNTQNL